MSSSSSSRIGTRIPLESRGGGGVAERTFGVTSKDSRFLHDAYLQLASSLPDSSLEDSTGTEQQYIRYAENEYEYDDDFFEDEHFEDDSLEEPQLRRRQQGDASASTTNLREQASAAKQNGDTQTAVTYLEQALVAVINSTTEEEDIASICTDLCACYNTLAMRHVESDEPEYAFELLRKADVTTAPNGRLAGQPATRLRLRAITLNNMGCYYKRRGKMHAALHCLERALKIEASAPSVENPAGTHLNVCAVLSQLGRHSEALRHAGCAVRLLEEQAASASSSSGGEENEQPSMSILAMALYNRAVEREFMGMANAAREDYGDACALAERTLGEESPMTCMLRGALKDFMLKQRRLAARGAHGRPVSAKTRPLSARPASSTHHAAAPQRPRSATVRKSPSYVVRSETERAYTARIRPPSRHPSAHATTAPPEWKS